jgi:hypothetical protein
MSVTAVARQTPAAMHGAAAAMKMMIVLDRILSPLTMSSTS